MTKLFDVFPYLENDKVIIRKMDVSDIAMLSEISNNDNVYKYISPFLYKKSNKMLETAIKKRANKITVGYRINEDYWNKKIASNALNLMVEYLVNKIGITELNAFVIPENIYSAKVLLNNGFVKEDYTSQEKNWGGQEIVFADVYTYKMM